MMTMAAAVPHLAMPMSPPVAPPQRSHTSTTSSPLGQGDRGIMEFNFGLDGRYMFHSHVNEFSELGWRASLT